ncbi:V-type proton ATPase subunit G 2-like protein [Cricetulus griseus]|uniref:V-type proton ATPase subunit G 2-like protein n=1 Tax=Cricetulus griseus TaxID=10029 RepID=A0A061IKG4_CRIGR|nr:V-type proton ATPase subunit G 2-like protein [Cricetulus griseus]
MDGVCVGAAFTVRVQCGNMDVGDSFMAIVAMGSQGNLSAEVEQATRRQVQGMQSSQQRNRERVLAQLLGMVCDVRPQVHPNYRVTV